MEVMFKVMSKAGAAPWHVAHFATEKEARAHANQEYKAGCNIIELYGETRIGYGLICSHREHWKVAVERIAAEWAESFPGFI